MDNILDIVDTSENDCELLIKELFIRGIVNYIQQKKFPCLQK